MNEIHDLHSRIGRLEQAVEAIPELLDKLDDLKRDNTMFSTNQRQILDKLTEMGTIGQRVARIEIERAEERGRREQAAAALESAHKRASLLIGGGAGIAGSAITWLMSHFATKP